MKRLKWSDERGFTLVEILVVIAIIAIMLAIAGPSITGFVNAGTSAAKAAEKNTVRTALDSALAASSTGAITAQASAALIPTSTTNTNPGYYLRAATTYSYTWSADGTTFGQD